MTVGGITGGRLRRITSSTQDDDVDPAYLPAQRGFVFASNRQSKTRTVVNGQTFYALDEYERERVLNLHTMAADGSNIQQITVNASHERNPVVRPNGDIMFARWEHVGGQNRFTIFRVKPDGTDLFVLYGQFSPGNSFLHPRDMDPSGPYKGFVASSLMPLSGTQEGGALVFIDVANYSEHGTPVNAQVVGTGGQSQPTEKALNFGRGLSEHGRITTPYPLWDGTNRVLLAYAPCQVTRNGVVVSCATLTPDEIARLSDRNRLAADVANDPLQDNVRPSYAIYMFDPAQKTFLIVAAPPPGFMYTDPIPLQARPEPNAADPTSVDAALAAQGLGLIEVRSIYDTDGLQRMGETVFAAADLPPGCTEGIAKTAPADPLDTRAQVADLVRMKDPADAAYRCAPPRFVRATRAAAPVTSTMGVRGALGETDFEPQQILGYAPIEPDGSFKLHVPADVPLALTVTDAYGRGFQTHLNWIQVRPGERRTCMGCHSPRRGASINSGTTVNTLPAGLKFALRSQHQPGETLASLRTRLDPSALKLNKDMEYVDVWADTSVPGVTARAPITLRYTGNPNPADDLATPAPDNGFINYPTHIQPLWTRDRGANTCTNCHNDPARLDLRANIAGTGRLVSYEELVVGDPVIDQATGLPVTRIENGAPVVVRGPALVETNAGGARGLARSSRLIEILFGQTLKASAEARAAHPTPTAPDHSTMLNAAEKRLLAEWVDLGGLYYNDLTNGGSGVRVTALSQQTFATQVQPILRAQCAMCHQPGGVDGTATGQSFARNRYVLTGSVEGDYHVTLSMISDACQPAANALLRRPSTVPHPDGAIGQTTAVLPAGSANYNTIAAWIQSGCVP
jgi:mono/diheme cytochrome c family protein